MRSALSLPSCSSALVMPEVNRTEKAQSKWDVGAFGPTRSSAMHAHRDPVAQSNRATGYAAAGGGGRVSRVKMSTFSRIVFGEHRGIVYPAATEVEQHQTQSRTRREMLDSRAAASKAAACAVLDTSESLPTLTALSRELDCTDSARLSANRNRSPVRPPIRVPLETRRDDSEFGGWWGPLKSNRESKDAAIVQNSSTPPRGTTKRAVTPNSPTASASCRRATPTRNDSCGVRAVLWDHVDAHSRDEDVSRMAPRVSHNSPAVNGEGRRTPKRNDSEGVAAALGRESQGTFRDVTRRAAVTPVRDRATAVADKRQSMGVTTALQWWPEDIERRRFPPSRQSACLTVAPESPQAPEQTVFTRPWRAPPPNRIFSE